MAAGAHDRVARTTRRRRLARGALGRPGDPGAGRLRHPRPAASTGRSTGCARRTRPRGCGCCWASRTAAPGSRVDHRTGGGARPRRTSGSRCAGCCRTSADEDLAGAPLVFHALGLAEWLFVTRFCPRCGGHLAAARVRPRAGLRRLRHAAVPAHRPGGDHGRHVAASRAPRTSAACSAARRSGPRAATRRWPASASRGRRSRTPYAARSLEEAGVVVGDVEYFGNQPWPLPASLMLGLHRPRGVRPRSTSTTTRSRTPGGSPAPR